MRKDIQTVFQDPNSALDPRMTIENILSEPSLLHGLTERPNEKREVSRLFEAVGLEDAIGKAFPYELSSGQKQRIAIAKAIATNPRFILCDEPVSALDVSVQSQILNLLLQLKEKFGMTYLFISHNLGVVRHMSDRIAVMYLGRIVETGLTEEVFTDPKHPYTKALLSSSPIPDPSKKSNHIVLPGEVPLCSNIPEGCPFHPRCREATEKCRNLLPGAVSTSPFHSAACHLL
jgi:oligopeptide/dipeptide ABC transporter ATP-binding protein